ncbi:MAG: hypothetical protein C4582_11460 [Desulfobacteraceae bacterium]|jgi:drug/metabolite transporter (DMT)-like permease|nr:MAG: hypothetical protein C4582_11460 [Desulfobacteraceae bacterium]
MNQSPFRGYIFVAFAAVLWASSGTAGKALFSSGISPFDLVQIRVTVSCLCLGAILAMFRPDLLRIRPRDIGYFYLLGGVVMGLVQITYFYSISKIQVAAAILLQYTSPVLVAIFSMCFWHEKASLRKVAALVLAVGGCYLVVGGYNLALLQMNTEGVAAALISAFCFAVYTLLGEYGMHRYAPWTVLFYSFFCAAISWNCFFPPFQAFLDERTPFQWGMIFYVAIAGTLMPFALYLAGVNLIRSTRASITATLEPILAAGLAFVLLGEVLEPFQLAGGTLVIASVLMIQTGAEHDENSPATIRGKSGKEINAVSGIS